MFARWNATREATGYRSQFEADVAKGLPEDGVEYEAVRIPYTVSISSAYKPDWVMKKQAIVLEAKGRFAKDDRDKMQLIREQYPDLDIRMVFQSLTQKVTPKMTVADWCERHGILCCKGPSIPPEWVKHKPRAKQRRAFDRLLTQ